MSIRSCAVADLDFAYTEARKSGLLDEVPDDSTKIKSILARLQEEHGFTLNGNGFPQGNRQAGWPAATVWACLAADVEGKKAVKATHAALREKGVWVWPQGAIEQVTHADTYAKGEDAIIKQEKKLLEMGSEEITDTMPAFQACFEWIRCL